MDQYWFRDGWEPDMEGLLDATSYPMRWVTLENKYHYAINYSGNGSFGISSMSDMLSTANERFMTAWIRHLVCELTDSEYSALVSAWAASVEAFIKKQHADPDYTLSFSNSHTIEA